jgi:anti-sigma factor RsiW
VTSTTDRAGHPDVTEISDFTEGLLPPSRAADVRRHLEACALCADVHASLEEIRGLLGTLPGAPRMPDDVTGRIDAALAAEALLNATAPPAPDVAEATGAAADRAGADEPLAASDDRTPVSRETSVSDRPSGRARTATTGPGRKDRKRLGRRKAAVLGTVLGAAALGLGSVLVTSLTGGGGPATDTGGHQASAADTFSQGTLKQQVADLLAKDTGGGSRTPRRFGMESENGSGGPRIYKQPTVPDCVQQGIGREDAALATQQGTYRGTAAMLVILPDTHDSTRVTAYIVDATCVKNPSTATAEVLLENSYARP